MTDLGTWGWVLREGLRYGGLYLATRGIGDAALWEGISGAIMAAAGSVWSWRARKALHAAAETPR